jgi:K+-sensing histidine kinase KdpD
LEGSGLALAIVEGIVRSHDGAVTVGDALGGGAVFTLALPLRQGNCWRQPCSRRASISSRGEAV